MHLFCSALNIWPWNLLPFPGIGFQMHLSVHICLLPAPDSLNPSSFYAHKLEKRSLRETPTLWSYYSWFLVPFHGESDHPEEYVGNLLYEKALHLWMTILGNLWLKRRLAGVGRGANSLSHSLSAQIHGKVCFLKFLEAGSSHRSWPSLCLLPTYLTLSCLDPRHVGSMLVSRTHLERVRLPCPLVLILKLSPQSLSQMLVDICPLTTLLWPVKEMLPLLALGSQDFIWEVHSSHLYWGKWGDFKPRAQNNYVPRSPGSMSRPISMLASILSLSNCSLGFSQGTLRSCIEVEKEPGPLHIYERNLCLLDWMMWCAVSSL